jgi:RimJ/RimL family protein N-acetyltransferase
MNGIAVRQLVPDDWELYRKIRLEALKAHPEYFSPSRDEHSFSEADWRERLENLHAATFGLFAGNEIIGLSVIVREGNNPASERAFLVGTYIRKDFRGQGLSAQFFKVRMEWAKKQKHLRTLRLEHREDNLPMLKAHEKFGFTLNGSREQNWPDGTRAACLIYELRLQVERK